MLNSKHPIFVSFLEKIKNSGISFSENPDNGIFTKGKEECRISNNILYRHSGIARTWRTSKDSKAICKGKNIDEDFVPMSDEDFYNVYLKSLLFTMLKI